MDFTQRCGAVKLCNGESEMSFSDGSSISNLRRLGTLHSACHMSTYVSSTFNVHVLPNTIALVYKKKY